MAEPSERSFTLPDLSLYTPLHAANAIHAAISATKYRNPRITILRERRCSGPALKIARMMPSLPTTGSRRASGHQDLHQV